MNKQIHNSAKHHSFSTLDLILSTGYCLCCPCFSVGSLFLSQFSKIYQWVDWLCKIATRSQWRMFEYVWLWRMESTPKFRNWLVFNGWRWWIDTFLGSMPMWPEGRMVTWWHAKHISGILCMLRTYNSFINQFSILSVLLGQKIG